MTFDERMMRRALALAANGRTSVSPNPMVGAVIVRDGANIGEGWHRRAGEPHAEIEAFRSAGNVRGATLYVTLEPCAHHGRTPPCADAVVAAGVTRVVVAMEDPHEKVRGEGIRRIREAGIEVEVGLLAGEAERLNEKFLHSVRSRRPFLLLKAGMTVDGKLATSTGRSQWITSSESRERSLLLREEYDAILAGSGTVITDDPQLTRRLGLASSITPWTRVVVDTTGSIPSSARIFDDGGPTIVYTSQSPAYERLPPNVDVVACKEHDGRIDLDAVLRDLDSRGIRSVIAEGGSLVHSELIRRRLWQKMLLFVAPMIVGGASAPSIFSEEGVLELSDAYRFRFEAAEMIGNDVLLTCYPDSPTRSR